MFNKYSLPQLLLVLMIIFFGCSSPDNPVNAPDSPLNMLSVQDLRVCITDNFPDGIPAAGMGTLGIFTFHLDYENSTADLIPLRSTALTDVLEIVDITNFLAMAPCTDCARIKSVAIDSDDNFVVSIGIKHPFPAGDPLKPISGQNRADLHVFNVEGTMVSNAACIEYPGMGKSTADFKLVNADGYSAYLDTVLDDIYPTDATIHPYITHFDDYSAGNFDPANAMGFASVTDPPPSGNLVMAMGCDYDYQDYVFNIDGDIDVLFAIGCTYAVSAASKTLRFTPEYRVPQHLKKAASEVSVEIITNDLKGGDSLSSADIEIYVVDISHGVDVGGNLDQMLADSSVDDIFVEIPGVTSSLIIIDGNNPVSGSGHDPTDPLIYSATITNEASADEGTYAGLVKVSDSYMPGQNQSPLLNGMDGIKRVDPLLNPLSGTFAISEFATYNLFEITVETSNADPIADLKPERFGTDMGNSVFYWGTDSYDTDGSIVQYEFDFDLLDGDLVNFEADETNTSGEATSFRYMEPGLIIAALRVTDNLGGIDYDTVSVPIGSIDIIYVDDSNTSGIEDGSHDNPYNTIQEGISAATAGFQVWVDDSGNNYNGPVSTKADVILRSVNWDTSDGGNQSAIYGTSGYIVTVIAYSTIDGFKIHGTSTSGVYVNGAEAVMKNCLITGIKGSSGIVTVVRVNDAPGALIENCDITDSELNTATGGILNCMYVYNSPCTIRGCRIYDNRKTEDAGIINVIYCSGCSPQLGYNLEIYQNQIYEIDFQSSGFINGIYVSNYTSDAEIHNNLLYDFDMISGGMAIGLYFSNAQNINITNNVFHDFQNNTWCTGLYVDGDSVNLAATNNIVSYMHNSSGTPVGWAVYFSTTNISWDYNDVYQVGSVSVPSGVGNIFVDPEFVNPGPDFHLDSGSPCIDTGDPTIFDPDSSRSDMGCYGGPDGNW